jgi:hypothetical protein
MLENAENTLLRGQSVGVYSTVSWTIFPPSEHILQHFCMSFPKRVKGSWSAPAKSAKFLATWSWFKNIQNVAHFSCIIAFGRTCFGGQRHEGISFDWRKLLSSRFLGSLQKSFPKLCSKVSSKNRKIPERTTKQHTTKNWRFFWTIQPKIQLRQQITLKKLLLRDSPGVCYELLSV